MSHGGSLAEARRLFPQAPEPRIDLSTGINPVPYSFAPLALEAFTRLPEAGELAELQAIAARAYGVGDPAMVVAAPGTQILINLLPLLFPRPSIAILGPTYGEYRPAWARAGAAVREVTQLGALAPAAAVMLCNPNNPDGRRHRPSDILAAAAGATLLIVDEAFADFEDPDDSLAPRLTAPHQIVLRSFGKAYGLAGLRLGFAIAAPVTAARIRDALGPWAVSFPALRIARQALADTAWRDSTGARLRQDAARLDDMLQAAGCRKLGGTTLFRLVHTPQAGALFTRLGTAGIHPRRFPASPTHLRFGIPAPADWKRLAAALAG
jgi:cobalamin biosynthetic protein CobC